MTFLIVIPLWLFSLSIIFSENRYPLFGIMPSRADPPGRVKRPAGVTIFPHSSIHSSLIYRGSSFVGSGITSVVWLPGLHALAREAACMRACRQRNRSDGECDGVNCK